MTAFLMMGDDAPAGVANDGTATTQSNPGSASGTGGGATQPGGMGGTSGMMSASPDFNASKQCSSVTNTQNR